jgi:RNA polymerase subunit RPABC4/transcription elongation factor Spt4
MRPENQIDPQHNEKRGILRVIGPLMVVIGLIFLVVGMVSFFASFGGHGSPRLFWCCFVGLPLIWLGSVLSGVGFLGAAARYMAGESAPVAKDTFNYMADGTKEGVKTVATAVSEGLASGGGIGKPVQLRCHKCNQLNDADSKFCKECGTSLLKSKACPACNELNDPDAKFCDNCGRALG